MSRARAALVAATCLAAGVLSLFGVGLADAQHNDRAAIATGVQQRAQLAAALLDSVFQSVAGQATQAPALYGAAQISPQVLDAHAAGARYLAVTDSTGKVLAASSGFDPQARREVAGSAALRFVVAGRPWGVGDVRPYGDTTVIDVALGFASAHGRRAVVVGVSPSVFEQFATPELRSIPGVAGARNTLLDGNGVVLATSDPAGKPGRTDAAGALARPAGVLDGRYFQEAPLANTTLRVVLSAPEGALFAPVSGRHELLPWLLLLACAVVAAVAIALGAAAVSAGGRLRQLNHRLEELNGELTSANAALEQRAAELARSNEELDQFASIASHDLQEPLRKIRTYTQQLAVMEGDDLSEKGHEYVWRANAAGARMQTLIEDLLRYARVGTQGRPFEAVDLASVAADVLDDLSAQVDEAGATVTIGDLPIVHGDAPQLRQLLQNLVSNALKFRRDAVAPLISIEAGPVGAQVEITVRDNGIGFDPRYHQRIFRVFERLHGRSEYAGTGVGLALCRKIVERHGGVIRATGEEGRGATFGVVLPTGRQTQIVDVRSLGGRPAADETGRRPAHV